MSRNGKAFGWDDERDAALRRMVSQSLTQKEISKRLDTHPSVISKRIKALGLVSGRGKVVREPPDHIARYERARRGFIVPPSLKGEYHNLLKTGMSIEAVCRRLGIKKFKQ